MRALPTASLGSGWSSAPSCGPELLGTSSVSTGVVSVALPTTTRRTDAWFSARGDVRTTDAGQLRHS